MRIPQQLTITVLLCASSGLTGPLDAHADATDPEWERADARLTTTVSVLRVRTNVSDLLQELSTQTGVKLTAGMGDGAGDQELAVFVKEASLRKVMDSLWSLFSYRRSTWHWERESGGGQYQYRLSRPRMARTLAARLLAETQHMFEGDAAIMLTAANLSPTERKSALLQLEQLQFTGSKEELLEGFSQDERLWSGLRLFGSALPPALKTAVLRGNARPRIPVSALSTSGQAFVQDIFNESGGVGRIRDAAGNWVPMPPPTWVEFRTDDQGAAPSMFIEIEHKGGYAYLGGSPLKRAAEKRIHSLWLMPGDLRSDPIEGSQVPTPQQPLPEVLGRIMEARLAQLSAARGVSILARLSLGKQRNPPSAFGTSVREFLAKLGEFPNGLGHKWRNGFLLLSDPRWPSEEASTPPAEVISRMRLAVGKNAGVLPLRDFLEIAWTLNLGQLRRLETEFPVMRYAGSVHALLQIVAQSKRSLERLVSESGLPFGREIGQAARYANGGPLRALPIETEFTALRFRLDESEEQGDTPFLRGEVRTLDGNWRLVFGFKYGRKLSQ